MGLLNLFKRDKPAKNRKFIRTNYARSYASAKKSNLFAGFTCTTATADEEIQGSLTTMRARARQICQDNEIARKFLAMCKSNVILNGINFQAKTRREDGSFDTADNDRLEESWKIWGNNPKFCSMDHRKNFVDLSRQVVETMARDGEVFIRLMRGVEDNPFQFSLWVLEADAFSVNLNKVIDNDTAIIMAIEQDKYGRPLAYHQTVKEPGLQNTLSQYQQKTERIPAEDIIHLYIQERPGQSRGVPWLNTAIRPLDMLGQFQISELTSSRIQSSAMGFFTSSASDSYVGTGVDDDENLVTEFEPATFQQLPQGMEFQAFNPGHPNTSYTAFTKQILRSVASGLLVNYNNLSGDLESVNYSSIRAGHSEERAQWQMLQNYVIENFNHPVYKQWLRMAITSGWFEGNGNANLPMSKVTKFENVRWIPRGWPYVNPLQEIQAQSLAVQLGIENLTDITETRGKEWSEVIEQLASERKKIDELELKFPERPIGDPDITEQIYTTESDGDE